MTLGSYIVKINDVMARPRVSGLTTSHLRVLTAVALRAKDHGSASVTELVAELRLAGQTSLGATLRIIQRNGFIDIFGGGKRGRRRTVALTEKGKASLGLAGLPVLGQIPAGRLSEVTQHCDGMIADHELLPHKPGDFLLVIDGDSMIGDGILPGDKVLLRPNVQVQSGEIAAVQVGYDHHGTLKRVYLEPAGGRVILRASNPAYSDIVVPTIDVHIAGVFRGLIRIPGAGSIGTAR